MWKSTSELGYIAWTFASLHAIEQTYSQGQRRVDGVKSPKFDSTQAETSFPAKAAWRGIFFWKATDANAPFCALNFSRSYRSSKPRKATKSAAALSKADRDDDAGGATICPVRGGGRPAWPLRNARRQPSASRALYCTGPVQFLCLTTWSCFSCNRQLLSCFAAALAGSTNLRLTCPPT